MLEPQADHGGGHRARRWQTHEGLKYGYVKCAKCGKAASAEL